MRVIRLARALPVLAFLLAVAGVGTAEAQTGKITGVVTDAASGQPIEGVQVVIQGTGRGAVTGANGRYFILSVPPGTYSVTARRIGYQSAETRGLQVTIDATAEANFRLGASTSTLQAVRIQAATTPLIQPGNTGSRTAITADEIDALPTTNIAGVLALQLGFLSVPTDNPDVTSVVDERRGINAVRIRGGRSTETQTLIDGIQISNFVFGGPAFDITGEAVQQVDFQRGGFEPQYGNAMSGIINIATREGGTDLKGAVGYQSSRLAGALGSDADAARGADFVQGHMGGPVPGTREKLRWFVAGRQNSGAAQTLEFDDQIANPFANSADIRGNTPFTIDFLSGWRGVGFNTTRDVLGKLTYHFTPSLKLNVGTIDYQQQTQFYNPAFQFTGYNVAAACADAYPDQRDYCYRQFRLGDPQRFEDLLNNVSNFRGVQEYVIQGSTRADRALTWFNLNHTIGRTNYQIRGGRLEAAREACNYLTGLCLGDKIRNFTTAPTVGDFVLGQFTPHSRHGAQYTNPGAASENFAGAESNTTYSLRGDVQSQVSDHHNVQGGAFFQRHDIRFYEAINTGKPFDNTNLARSNYGGQPWDAAVYLQDRIEYDFLTIKLGFRFDYTHAPGEFFANPLDPTNGTTAREVCEGSAFGSTPYRYTDTVSRVTIQGLAACNARPELRDSATRIARRDDFTSAPVRRQFSPRIGVQFPLTERSSFFANWGIYSQNPIYHTMYTGTGIGRVATSDIVDVRGIYRGVANDTIRAGTNLEGTIYGPQLTSDPGFTPLVGNPQLAIERTSAYEVGFQTEVGRNYAISATGYAKDQSGLTGFRSGGVLADGTRLSDFGQTYSQTSTSLTYRVLVNTDYQTVRGIEMVLRRRLANYWAFAVQYGFQQVTTNAAAPELEIQKIIEGDVAVRREIRSEVDQPHTFTGVLRFEFDNRVPDFRFSRLLKNTKLAITTRAASGLPYTPTAVIGNPNLFTGSASSRLERNSGTSPATWSIDFRAEKGFRAGNLRYAGFVQVNNVTDRKNCTQVYPTTGDCDSGALAASRSYIGGRQGGSDPGSIGIAGASSSALDRPNMFGARRSIWSGVRLSF